MTDGPAPDMPVSSPGGEPAAGTGLRGARTADDIQGTVVQVIGDLAGIAGWLPYAGPEDRDRAALLLTALSAECAEAATMCRSIGTGQERSR
jgi:hypothetical protein